MSDAPAIDIAPKVNAAAASAKASGSRRWGFANTSRSISAITRITTTSSTPSSSAMLAATPSTTTGVPDTT